MKTWLPVLLAALSAAVAPVATAAPRLEVSPSSFDVTAAFGTTTSLLLRLGNTGDAPLTVTLTPRGTLPSAGGLQLGETFARLGDGSPTPDAGPAAARATAPFASGPGPRALPRVGPARTSLTGVRALILHSAGNVDALRDQLRAFPEFQSVDTRDLTAGALTLAELTPYACVLVGVNTSAFDEIGTGDVLADYVDGGGGLVLTLASYLAGYEIRGRLLSGEYMPFMIGVSGDGLPATLGNHDALHPIMAGVTDVASALRARVSMRPGAVDVASWSDGAPLVATRPRVAAINLFVALPGYASGQVAELLRNAMVWSVGQVDWLRLSTSHVTLPPGTELVLDVEFDATTTPAGLYTADLVLSHDDPTQDELRIPVRFTVTGVPKLRLTAGEAVIGSTAIFSMQGEATSHHLVVPDPRPDTLRLELVLEGDYGDAEELATVSVEGVSLGGAGQVGGNCSIAENSFALGRSLVSRLLADGAVDAVVRNTPLVDPLCPTNHHTVRLRYERPGDVVQFEPVFIGRASDAVLVFQNVGGEDLHVSAVRTDSPAFTIAQDTLNVAPGKRRTLVLRFRPTAVGLATSTLTFECDDPSLPPLTVRLTSEGLPPPDVDATPLALDARLSVGGVATRQVTIRNTGGSPLPFKLRARGSPRAAPRPQSVGQPFTPASPALTTPEPQGDAPLPAPLADPRERSTVPHSSEAGAVATQPSERTTTPGATVLILQDAEPWATHANENVLSSFGIGFDMATTAELDTLDLGRYHVVILASDQPSRSYTRISDHAEKLEDFVGGGGVLEAHVAGWGFNAGDATQVVLPGGVTVERQTSDLAHIVRPDHPLAEGAPRDLPGTSAAHAYLQGLPEAADVVALNDFGFPVLAVYSLGRGMVVATGLTLEFAHTNSQTAGPLLEALIRYSVDAYPHWLSFEPTSGVLAPGGEMPVTLRFDAHGLDGGVHSGELDVMSDDPDEPRFPIALSLQVDGAPSLEVQPRAVSVTSRASYVGSGARTSHRIAVNRPRGTALIVDLEAFGDFGGVGEEAVITAEGIRLGSVGAVGGDCVLARRSFFIPQMTADQILADGIIELSVQNSVLVDPNCANEHLVRVSHPETPFPLRFRDTFVGARDTRGFFLRNRGTSTLTVRSLSANDARFRLSRSSAVIEPRHELLVQAEFSPDVPGDHSATLRIESDDPNLPSTTLTFSGRSLAAPVLELALEPISVDVLAGEVVTREAMLRNTGGSPLVTNWLALADWHSVPVGAPAAAASSAQGDLGTASHPAAFVAGGDRPAASPMAAPVAGVASSATHATRAPRPVPSLASARARVLIVADFAPWGRLTDEALLDTLGIPFDRVPSSEFAAADLTPYSLVLLAGDQSDAFYVHMHAQRAKLAAWVERGGVLEAHLAAWGSNGGESSLMSIPGEVHAQQSFELHNQVLVPGHPLVEGIASPFQGTFASMGTLIGLPEDALVVTRDTQGAATLAVYRLGAGLVIAGTHPYEYGFNTNQASGRLLRNLVPFALAGSGQWLKVSQDRYTLPPWNWVMAKFTLDSRALESGDYLGSLQLTTNDPLATWRAFPVNLRVAGVHATMELERDAFERRGRGRKLKVRLGLPKGTDVAKVELNSVRLNGVPALVKRPHDDDGDDGDDDDLTGGNSSMSQPGEAGSSSRGHDRGRRSPMLRLRFDHASVLATLPDSGGGELVLTGALSDGERFLARDSVKVCGDRDRDDDGDDDLAAGGASASSAANPAPERASLRLGPNPMQAGVRLQLELSLARGGRAEVQVFSLDGRLVREVVAGERGPGVHTLEWDGRDRTGRLAPAGVYLVRVRAPGLMTSRRVVRVR